MTELRNKAGTMAEFRTVIDRYPGARSKPEKHQLLKQLILAKSWIVVEVANILSQRGNPDRAQVLAWYREHLPAWLTWAANESMLITEYNSGGVCHHTAESALTVSGKKQ